MSILVAIVEATTGVFLAASPYLLLGLALAGLFHVLLPPSRVAGWLGRPGFGSVVRAAALGTPLPLCSCSVLPVAIELDRKGARREATLSFLVSTPETGADSIALTWGLMGPVMAIARPLAAVATSLVAGGLALLGRPERSSESPASSEQPSPTVRSDEAVSPNGWLARIRRAIRYGFVEMVDEIALWLLLGLVLTGVLSALLPPGTFQRAGLGAPLEVLLAMLVGVPLYMCASASTPVAAALMAGGMGPGAALAFLLSGPATNVASLTVVSRIFGRRFVLSFLAAVLGTAYACGLLLHELLELAGVAVTPRLAAPTAATSRWLAIASAVLLALLLLWRLARGAGCRALRDLRNDLRRATLTPWAGSEGSPPLSYRGRRESAPIPNTPAVETRGLTATYSRPGEPALQGIDLEIPVGARVALVGPNGAGKSTLLRVLAGLLPAAAGRVRLYGLRVGACHHRVAYLPQRSEIDWQFPISVEQLVMTGRYVHLGWLRRPSERDRQIVAEVLDELQLDAVRHRPIGELSGGLQQRALLGRALAQRADLLLLDEPLNAVDNATRAIIAELLDRLRRHGRTVVVATHDIGRLESEYDAALYLADGRETPAPPGAFTGARMGAETAP